MAGVNGGLVSFLSEKLYGRGQLKEPVPEQVLHGKIHIGDKIRRAFGQDGLDGGGVSQKGTGLTDSLHRLPGQTVSQDTHAAASPVRMET